MAHPNGTVVRRAYEAINRGDIDAFVAEFAEDARWHGSGTEVTGAKAIGGLVAELCNASGGTLHIEVHDVLANDEHAVALQVTHAKRAGRAMADRVVYVFHVREGRIAEAWFTGDPRVQDDFWA